MLRRGDSADDDTTWQDSSVQGVAWERHREVTSLLKTLVVGQQRLEERVEAALRCGGLGSQGPSSMNLRRPSEGSPLTSVSALAFGLGSEGSVETPLALAAVGEQDALQRDISSGQLTRARSWQHRPTSGSGGSGFLRPTKAASTTSLEEVLTTGGTYADIDAGRRCVLHPESTTRLVLDLATVLALFVDSILIPYSIAWPPAPGRLQSWQVLNFCTAAFWTVEFFAGFVSGYYDKGVLVLSYRAIFKRYLRTFFVPNLLVLTNDIFSLVLPFTLQGHSQGDSKWIGLLPRVLKLQRLVVVAATLQKWSAQDKFEAVFSKIPFARQMRACTRVLQLVVFLLWLNHIGACLWRLLGGNAIGLWLDAEAPFPEGGLQDYLHTYLWSTQAMLAGGLLVQPTTAAEMVFAIFIIQAGLMMCSIVVGILADTLLAVRMANKDSMDQKRQLKRYMNQNGVPSHFAASMEDEVRSTMHRERRIIEKDVLLLKHLSQQSKDALKEFAFGPLVRSQVFIRSLIPYCPSIVRDICANALESMTLDSGDRAFEVGNEAKAAYLVMWGSFEYIVTAKFDSRRFSIASFDSFQSFQDLDEASQSRSIKEHKWISQLALFCELAHSGTMMAASQGEYLSLDGGKFRELLATKMRLELLLRDYIDSITKARLRLDPHQPLCDVHPCIDHAAVLTTMPLRTRTRMSKAAHDLHEEQHKALDKFQGLFGASKWEGLLDEVNRGECDLVVDSEFRAWNAHAKETVQRIVSSVAVRLKRHDGRVLAQIGTCGVDGGKPQAGLQLPGVTVTNSEVPADVAERYLEVDLGSMSGCICREREKAVSELKSSPQGVTTKYLRHVVYASLEEGAVYSVRGMQKQPEPRVSRRRSTRNSLHSRNLNLGRSFGLRRQTWEMSHQLSDGSGKSFQHVAGEQNFCSMGAFVLNLDSEPDEHSSSAIFAWVFPEDFDQASSRKAIETFLEGYVPMLQPDQFDTASVAPVSPPASPGALGRSGEHALGRSGEYALERSGEL